MFIMIKVVSKIKDKFIVFSALAVTIIFYLSNWSINGPTIQADESGYLVNGAALAGFWIDAASSYHAGYSLFLVPAFWFGGDPHNVFALVKLINSIMWGATVLVLYCVLSMLFPTVNHWRLVSATLISIIYPAWITISGFAFSESAYVLFFLISMYFALRVAQNGGYFWVAWGISLGYLFAIHPKSVSVLISALIAAALIAKARSDWHRLLGFLVIVIGLVFFYKYCFSPWLISGMTTGHYPPDLHYPSVRNYFTFLMNNDGIKELAVRFSGHVMYIGLATLGLAFYPFVSSLKVFHQVLINKNITLFYTGNNPVYVYVGLAFIGTMLLSALSFTSSGATRLDHWIYGRYVEGVILPLLAIGFLTMGTRKIIASTILSGVFAVILWVGIDDYAHTAPFNVPGFWQEFFIRDKSPICWYLLGALPLIIMAMFRITYIRFIVIASVFVFASILQIQWHVKANMDSGNRQYLADFIRNNYEKGSSIGFDVDHDKSYNSTWFFRQYAFYLYDYNYKRMDAANWYNDYDGPLISFSNGIVRRHDCVVPIAVEHQNGPVLWEKSHENYKQEFLDETITVSPTSVKTRLLLGNGWHTIENSHIWSKANAELCIPVTDKFRNNNYAMRLTFSVFNASKISPKRILVNIEGSQVAEWVIDSGDVQERIIPLYSDLLETKADEVRIRLQVPEATSPAALSMSNDSRILGIGLREIEFLQGSDFYEALKRYNCQPPKCLHWEAEHENIPMKVGKQVSNAVRSTGQSGFLVYGPYKTMNAGSYMLELRGMINSTNGRVITDVVGDKGQHTFARFEGVDDVNSGEETVLLSKKVMLDKAVSDLEVRVWVDELVDIELTGYSLIPIDDNENPSLL